MICVDSDSWAYLNGSISIGDFSEIFRADAKLGATSYMRSWRKAAKDCLQGRSPVAFFTSVSLDEDYGFSDAWLAFRQDATLSIINSLVPREDIELSADGPQLGKFFQAAIDDYGSDSSVWKIPLASIEGFLAPMSWVGDEG